MNHDNNFECILLIAIGEIMLTDSTFCSITFIWQGELQLVYGSVYELVALLETIALKMAAMLKRL